MIIMAADGKIDQANEQAERMFKYGRFGLNGLEIERLLPARYRDRHINDRKGFMKRPTTRPMGGNSSDLYGLRSDGSEFPVEISLNPLHLDGKRLVAAAIRDITARKETEDKLRLLSSNLEHLVEERTAALRRANELLSDRTKALEQSNAELSKRILAQESAETALAENTSEYRTTFELAAVGIAHVAPDGKWLQVNQQLSDFLGYSREELLSMTFQDVTYQDDLEDDLQLVQQVLIGDIPSYSIEKRYVIKVGGLSGPAWLLSGQ